MPSKSTEPKVFDGGKKSSKKAKSPEQDWANSCANDLSVKVIGKIGKFPTSSTDKSKSKKVAEAEQTALVNSKNTKVHRPECLHKGKPMLAKESSLKSASVAYSLLIHSFLPTNEKEIERMFEVSVKNQAFHNLMKETFDFFVNFTVLIFFYYLLTPDIFLCSRPTSFTL